MRVIVHALGGLGDADRLEQLDRALRRIAVTDAEVVLDAFGHLAFDRQHRVQRGDGVLEDHRHVAAAHAAHLSFGQLQQVAAHELDAAGDGGVVHHAHETEDGQGADALAATRLAHEADHLAGGDGEGDAVDGVDHPLLALEGDGEIAHVEELVSLHGHSLYQRLPERLWQARQAARSPDAPSRH